MRYTHKKTDREYQIMEPAYRAVARKKELYGFFEDKKHDTVCNFYEILQLDPNVYLTDDDGNVYVAGGVLPNAAEWEISAVAICDYEGKRIERFRLTDDACVAQIRALWFEGDGDAVTPMKGLQSTRRVELVSTAYPNLHYCFTLSLYEGEQAFFSDSYTRRIVSVPYELASDLMQN